MRRKLCLCSGLAAAGPVLPVVAAVAVAFSITATAQGINEGAYDRCRAIPDDAGRLRCFENLTAIKPAPPPAATRSPSPMGVETAPGSGAASAARSASIGRWRLVRTPHPQGGKDAVSVMRSAELAGSDPEFAGLVLRCGEQDIEVLLAVIGQMSFRAHPHVTVKTARGTKEYDATVAPPGLLILLPRDATNLAMGAWQSAPDLTIAIDDDQHTIHGSVQLADLKPAADLLVASCPQQ